MGMLLGVMARARVEMRLGLSSQSSCDRKRDAHALRADATEEVELAVVCDGRKTVAESSIDKVIAGREK